MHLTHVPARGHFAHIPSPGCTGAVVLADYNGRPTLSMLEIDGIAVLAWMFDGAGEAWQWWLYVPLTAAEPDEFQRERPALIADWLRPRHGRAVHVGVAHDGVLVLVGPWRLPDVTAEAFTGQAIEAVSAEVRRALGVPEIPAPLRDELRAVPAGG